MKVRSVIFDWSGVISDDTNPVYESNMRMFEYFGVPRITKDQWRERSTLTPAEIMRNHGIQASEDELWEMYKELYADEVGKGNVPLVYPDARDALHTVYQRGHLVIVLSSHPEEHLIKEMKQYEIEGELFTRVKGTTRDKVAGLTDISKELELPPPLLLYVGDTVFDARAAATAGTRFAAKTGGYHSRERLEAEKHDLIVNSLTELAEQLE